MKFKSLKLATALTLTAITTFANANNTEEMIYNDDDLFNNKVAAQVTKHHPLDVATIAKLVKEPSRTALQANLGLSKNIRHTDEAEIWFYGLEIPTTGRSNEKCLVAFQFDIVDEQNSKVADYIGFNKANCEEVIAQELHKDKDHNNH